jgi:acetyl-CoA carboxylase biotin carboxyl carrier protein
VSLTAKDVAQITRLLEESSFDELYLEIDGLKLSLRRGSAPNAQSLVDPAAALAPSPAPPATPPDPNTLMVSAPLLGTFYRAPKPGAAPFVEIGSHVEEDTIIGIIEVMKLMNTVRAGVRGTVVQVLGRDGELVEYGETLMLVSKAD